MQTPGLQFTNTLTLAQVQRLQEGREFDDGRKFTPAEYQEMARGMTDKWKSERYVRERRVQESGECARAARAKETIVCKSEAIHRSRFTHVGLATINKLRTLHDPPYFTHTHARRYPTTDMTPEDLEKDYWDIVGNDKIRYSAEYGNDIDCTNYWSGFPLSKRGRALNGTNEESHLPEPEFGSEAFYR